MKTQPIPAAVAIPYRAIMQSEIFRISGPPIDFPRAITLLARAVHGRDLPEGIWSTLGEFTEAPLGDLLVASYWALSEWHGGQSSPTYAALCAVGRVYSPGPCARGPEPESCEADAYEMISAWFAAH